MPAQRPIRGYDRASGVIVEQLAWGDGTHDDGPLLQAMLDQCGCIWLPPGIFNTSIMLQPPKVHGCGIIGAVSSIIDESGLVQETRGTIIRATEAYMTVIKSPSFVTGPTYQNLCIDRAVPPTGGYGLDMNESNDHALLSNIFAHHHTIGFNLSTTGYSKAEYLRSEFNTNNGFNVVGQWQLGRLFANNNGGMGFAVTNAIPQGNSLGQWTGLSTFRNASHGIGFFGAVYDIRLSDSFFGGDGGSEVYIAQTGNNSNIFTNVEVEGGGSDFQWYFGPGSGHNSLVNCSGFGGKAHGLLSLCDSMVTVGGAWTNNPGYGVLAMSGRASLTGVHCKQNGWGIGATGGCLDISVIGCDVHDNTVPLDLNLAVHSTAFGNI